MDLNLRGKTAIVTGGSKGIGLAVVQALAREGAFVVAGARSSSAELDALVAAGSARAVEGDLTTHEAVRSLVAAAGPRVDILVNNVGRSLPRLNGFAAITDEEWLMSLTLNTMAAIRMTRAVLPAMRAAGSGSIVNVGSVNAWFPDPGLVDYSAAKAALWNVAKGLAKEVAEHGIRVNTVSPGPVATARWRPDQLAAVSARMLTGRLTRPEEVADVVAMLASERTANVTGATWTVDGGLVPTL